MEGGIRASGGAICPNKTKWFLIDYVWKRNKFVYRSIEDMPGNISIPNQEGNMMTIQREEPSSVNESLGIQLTLTGNQSKQKEVLKEKSEVFATQIRTRKCDNTTALWTFTNSFYPSMMYPMVATYFSEDDWNEIMRPALRATLSSAGMAKNFPRSIFFGPEKYQGLDVYHPYFLQEIIHLQTLFQESLRNSQTGRLLRANAEAFQIEIGIPFSISNTKYDIKTFTYYTPNGFYKSMWKFCSNDKHGIKIKEDFQDLPLLRKNDVPLMIVFAKTFKNSSLETLNFVRKHLKAYSLADITTINGKFISHLAFTAVESNGFRSVTWPRTPELSNNMIFLWQQAIKSCFLNQYSNSQKLLTQHQLGTWTKKYNGTTGDAPP